MSYDSDLPLILSLHGHTGQAPAPSPTGSATYPLKQPALPYQYSAQEPLIDNTTMMLHWSKHTATYIENVNKAIAPFPALQVWLWFQSKKHANSPQSLSAAAQVQGPLHVAPQLP